MEFEIDKVIFVYLRRNARAFAWRTLLTHETASRAEGIENVVCGNRQVWRSKYELLETLLCAHTTTFVRAEKCKQEKCWHSQQTQAH